MNTYLIYGNDYGLIKKKIDEIVIGSYDIIKYDLSEDKVDLLLDDASCISLFGEKKVLIGENSLFLTSNSSNVEHDLDYLSKYLNDETHDNIVIFTVISEKLDERKKIVKELKQKSNVFCIEKIDEKNLPSFVQNEFKNEGYKIDLKTANYFVNYVGNNVDIILSEIKKMIIYKDTEKEILIDDILSISSKAFNDNIFDFCDAIMKKDYKRIFEIYDDLLFLKTEPSKIISVIANQFILTYEVKVLASNGKSQNDIANLLNVHWYRVKLALNTNYMIFELEDIIKKLANLDYEIKSGNKDRNNGFKEFLINL